MPGCYVHYKSGRYPSAVPVKNLGWLTAHAAEVKQVTVMGREDGKARLSADGTTETGHEFTFMADFESFRVAERWVRRPSLAGANIAILP